MAAAAAAAAAEEEDTPWTVLGVRVCGWETGAKAILGFLLFTFAALPEWRVLCVLGMAWIYQLAYARRRRANPP